MVRNSLNNNMSCRIEIFRSIPFPFAGEERPSPTLAPSEPKAPAPRKLRFTLSQRRLQSSRESESLTTRARHEGDFSQVHTARVHTERSTIFDGELWSDGFLGWGQRRLEHGRQLEHRRFAWGE